MDSPRESRPGLPSLTALRAFAASAVFFGHAYFLMGPDPPQKILAQTGVCGVSFFFVLSGAILAYNYSAGFATRRFYLKRFARIYPVYALAFVVGTLALIAIDKTASFLTPELIFKNVFMIQGWFPDGNSLTVPATAWTLSCELLFYALFPFILPPLKRIKPSAAPAVGAALVVLAAFGPGFFYDHVVDTPFFLSPLAYLPQFALGCMVGLYLPQLTARRQSFTRTYATQLLFACGVAVIVAWGIMTTTDSVNLFVFVWPVIIVAGAAADRNGPHWLASRWIVFAGLWSYAFYSVHEPLLNVLYGALDDPPSLAVGLPLLVISFAGIWFVCALIFRFWEEPWRERITRSKPKEVVAAGLGER